jgi:TupA-like ATPgrasp
MIRHALRRVLPRKLRDFIRTVKSRPHDKICSLRFTFLRDSLLGRLFVDFLYFPYDIHIIFQQYKDTFGRYPNIIRPTTFNEYIQHSKVFRRKSLQTIFADKLVVRDYVKKRIGERHLVRLLWSGDDLHEAETMQLKVPFVIKANNSSGKNIFVTDPKNVDWHGIRAETKNWLKDDWSISSGEWQYRWIKPQFVIEEMLFDQSGKIPADWKFFTFHGKVRLFYIVFDRFGKEKSRIFYDESLERLDLELDETPLFKGEFVLPQNIREMIQLSEKLSNQEPLVRVDWYLVGSNPIFGELTLCPESGLGRFKPDRMDEILYDYFRNVQHPGSGLTLPPTFIQRQLESGRR